MGDTKPAVDENSGNISGRRKVGRPTCITPEILDAARELMAQGVSRREAARRVGVPERSLRRAEKPPTPEQLAELAQRVTLKKYGLSSAAYDALLKLQEGKCAICRTERRLYIDHCHTTGKVRGLLCNNCNVGIGHLGDSIERLFYAVRYLLAQSFGHGALAHLQRHGDLAERPPLSPERSSTGL